MNKYTILSIPVFLLSSLFFLSPFPVKAQQTTIVAGKVTRVNPPAIDVETSQGVQRFTIPQTVPVQKEDKLVGVQEISVNDKVTIEQSPQNDIVKVDVQPQSALDNLAPLLIGGVILLATVIIFLLAAKKSNKKFIKTSVSTKGAQ